MEVQVKLDVSAKDFWKIITDSIKHDMGKDVTIYEGLSFEKKLPTTLSGMVTAKVVIVAYKEEECYGAEFVTSRSTVHSIYHITKEEDGISVSYKEEETFEKKMDKWNAKLVKAFYKKSRTKKLVKKLKNIEKHIKGGEN